MKNKYKENLNRRINDICTAETRFILTGEFVETPKSIKRIVRKIEKDIKSGKLKPNKYEIL